MCDAELIGKTFEDKKIVLSVSERFYSGEVKPEAEVRKILCNAESANLVGKRVVTIAVKEGYIKKEDVLLIAGVPHAQVYHA